LGYREKVRFRRAGAKTVAELFREKYPDLWRELQFLVKVVKLNENSREPGNAAKHQSKHAADEKHGSVVEQLVARLSMQVSSKGSFMRFKLRELKLQTRPQQDAWIIFFKAKTLLNLNHMSPVPHHSVYTDYMQLNMFERLQKTTTQAYAVKHILADQDTNGCLIGPSFTGQPRQDPKSGNADHMIHDVFSLQKTTTEAFAKMAHRTKRDKQ